ncbi:transglutaminase family protein [uncultured Cellulomonas sp.]|uniref:transglutaminase family protein n=1 Tax=uncultured Cellulomonas sp. TaxID=189682 RepID=UPI002639C25B|nr:transglutaminase family protein [uncultured Cellulomonas sp.]
MSRLHVVHTTEFGYGGPVTASYNEARMTPLSGRGQTVLSASLDIDPHTWRHDYRDYWGSQVTAFEVSLPHQSLLIRAACQVEVTPPPWPTSPAGWDTVTSPRARDELAEFLEDSPATRAPADLAALAADVAGRSTPHRAAVEICGLLHDAVEYVPGATAVHSAAAEAWSERKGVCQDMAQLSVGALRSIGIPARYVSGYLHPRPGAELGEVVTGESHAWVEWWAGEWVPFDPTNAVAVAERHVVLGRGREYRDVAPLRGIYAGSGTDALVVQVRISREA